MLRRQLSASASADYDDDSDSCFKSTPKHCPDSGFISGVLTEDDVDVDAEACAAVSEELMSMSIHGNDNGPPKSSEHAYAYAHNSASASAYLRLDSGVDVDVDATEAEDAEVTFDPELNWDLLLAQDEDGHNQLHHCLLQGHTAPLLRAIALVPLPHRSILDIPNDHGQTLLHMSVLTRQLSVIRALVLSGCAYLQDCEGNNPVHLAACGSDGARALAEMTRPWTMEEHEHERLRLQERSQSQAQQQQVPFQFQSSLNQLNYEGQSPLHLATLAGSCTTVLALLQAGAHANAQELKGGRTALHYSVERRHSDIARCLVAAGCDVDAVDYCGRTAFEEPDTEESEVESESEEDC